MNYRNMTTGEVRELPEDLVASWHVAGNPKGLLWEPYVEPPPPPPCKEDYDAALQARILAHIQALPRDYQDLAELAALASAPNEYQAEAQALVTWIGGLWAKGIDYGVSPEAYVSALFSAHPAPY